MGDDAEKKADNQSNLVVAVVVIAGIGVCVGAPFGITAWTHRAHATKDLANYDLDKKGDLRLDPRGMQGKFERFDVVGNAAFAQSIARTWADDAQLARVRVTKCERGGVVDVGEDEKSSQVRYEFSASGSAPRERASEGHGATRRSGSASSSVGLRLTFAKGELVASSGSEPLQDAPPPAMGCGSMDRLGAAIAPSNMESYSLDLRTRRVKVDKDPTGKSVYKTLWRWEASGEDGKSANVCDATCTTEGSPDCPAR